MDIHVINLERSKQRWNSFIDQNHDIPSIRRFEAFDGLKISRNDGKYDGLFLPGITYTQGAVGCALSHLALWEKCIALDEPLTVCEDDGILHRDFSVLAKRTIQNAPSAWEFILWGWNFNSVCILDLVSGFATAALLTDQDQIRSTASQYRTATFSPQLFRLRRAFGIVCYTISPAGAKRMKSGCIPLRPQNVFFPVLNLNCPNTGIDIPMNGLYESMNAFAAMPPLVLTRNERELSTVQPRSAVAKPAASG